MSRERTSVVGVVVITACLTAIGLAAGWVVITQRLAQKSVSSEAEEAPAEEPAPRRKARARTSGSATEAQQVDASSTDLAPADALVAETEGSSTPQDDEASRGEEPVAPPVAVEPASEYLSAAVDAIAGTDDEVDARTIMEESQRRGEARFYRYDGLLQSFDAKNKMTDKRWTFDRVGSNGRSKAVLRFTAPAEVNGVALLIHNHTDRASDQWMWTPALQRDRRIALQDRSTRFFGTDFSFEDLEERDVDQYDYEMLGSEVIEGADSWKIETTPKKSRSSHYTHSIAWIRKDNYLQVRLDNFVDDEVVKRLTSSNLESIQGIWTARLLEMADLRRRTRTRLTLKEVSYNTPMNDQAFTLQAIRR